MLIQRILTPRIVAAVWGIFSAVTAYGYVGKSISALTPIEEIMPAESLAFAWMVAAGFLLVGAAVPSGNRAVNRCGGLLRAAGIISVTLLLTMWSLSYFMDSVVDGSRGWISGKNYLFLAMASMVSAWVAGRHQP